MAGRVLVVVAVLLGVTAATASEQWLELSPDTGPSGEDVTVYGHGFAHQSCAGAATLYWDGYGSKQVVPLAEDDSDPSFVATMTVPDGQGATSVTLRSLCGSGELTTPGPSADYLVTVPVSPTVESPSNSSDPTIAEPTIAGTDAEAARDPSIATDIATDITTSRADEPDPTLDREQASIVGEDAEQAERSPREETTIVDAGPRPVLMTETLPAIDELDTSWTVLLVAALLTALLLLLLAFPAELFNKTYEENRDEVHRILRIRRDRLPTWLGGTLFVGLGAALSAILAGSEGAAGNPTAQVIGFLVAIPVVTIAYGLPTELHLRARTRIAGTPQVLAPALVVAVACTGISLALPLEPPYLYGLFAGFVAARGRVTTATEGRATLAGVLCLLGCAALAFLAWTPVHHAAHGPNPTWPGVVADATLFWIVVLATESLVFALPPLRFLDGRKLRDWRLAGWLVPQVVAAAAFGYLVVLRGQENPQAAGVAKALAFFVVFGVLSVALWSYFRWPNRPTRPADPVSSVVG